MSAADAGQGLDVKKVPEQRRHSDPPQREWALAEAMSGASASQADLRSAFDSLFEQWSKDTVVTSSATKMISHRAYQKVIGMGKPVVGFILEKIEDGHFHWCWALHEITGQDPAKETESLEVAAKVWTKWGKENGYLTA